MQKSSEDSCSDWLDYNIAAISNVPESSGVFMMHQSMKILLIDSAENLRQKIVDSVSKPCLSEASRFRYMVTSLHKIKKDEILEDFKKRHEGKLPRCMN